MIVHILNFNTGGFYYKYYIELPFRLVKGDIIDNGIMDYDYCRLINSNVEPETDEWYRYQVNQGLKRSFSIY